MLGIGFKVSDAALPELRRPLRDYIAREYAAPAPSSPSSAAASSPSLSLEQDQTLDQFFQLKTDADLVRTPSAISRHVLLRYYAQLDRVAARFPCDPSASTSALRLPFTWNDSFCPRKKVTQPSVRFEQAAIMFNYGALESQLGVQADRSSADGLKTACRHFMLAAGAFAKVRDELAAQCLGARTPDMSAEGLGMLTALMLAQAQACFYEKAIKDQMRDAIKAKLVHQALEFYSTALELCHTPALNGTIDRMWSAHILFQVLCMKAATQYWQARASKEVALARGVGYGEEIARLRAADTETQEAIKAAVTHKLPASIQQSARALQKVIREHLQVAEKDNASVYLENVPKKHDLPPVGKASMVKPLMLTSDELTQELGEVDLFETFVPNAVRQEAASTKQGILDLVTAARERINSTNVGVKEKLHAMGLPASIEAFEQTSDDGIPQSIWLKIEHVQQTNELGGIGTQDENALYRVMQQRLTKNDRTSESAEKALREIERCLSTEEMDDNVCRQNYGGARWPRPMSSVLNEGFRADVDRFYRLVKEAKQSDRVVESKMNESRALLAMLTKSKVALDGELPRLEHDTSSCRDEIAEVSRLVLQLTELMEEKEQVLHDFAASAEKFNALPFLMRGTAMTANGDDASNDRNALDREKAFFQEHFVTKIDTICQEEQSLLEHLEAANISFEAKKATDSVMTERQQCLQRLSDAVDLFEQLSSHLKEGATFYDELATRIQQLKQTVEDHCSARELEKRELELNIAADEDMRQRDAQDAATAQQMMRDMHLRDRPRTGDQEATASDEAIARQLAGGSPQSYQLFPSAPQQQEQQQQEQQQPPPYQTYPAQYPSPSSPPANNHVYSLDNQQGQQQQQFSAHPGYSGGMQPSYGGYQQHQSTTPPAFNSMFAPSSAASPSAPQFGNYYAQQPQQTQYSRSNSPSSPPQPQHLGQSQGPPAYHGYAQYPGSSSHQFPGPPGGSV